MEGEKRPAAEEEQEKREPFTGWRREESGGRREEKREKPSLAGGSSLRRVDVVDVTYEDENAMVGWVKRGRRVRLYPRHPSPFITLLRKINVNYASLSLVYLSYTLNFRIFNGSYIISLHVSKIVDKILSFFLHSRGLLLYFKKCISLKIF